MLKKETRDVYDLIELMDYMESQGFMSMKRYWKERDLESYNAANEVHLDMWFGEGLDEEVNEYHREVRRLLNLEEEDTVLMKIRW